jgi:hypothetical protein
VSQNVKTWAVWVRVHSGFQVAVRAQYAYEAWVLARPQLAARWPDDDVDFAACRCTEVVAKRRRKTSHGAGARP